jgi:hypothetical protein
VSSKPIARATGTAIAATAAIIRKTRVKRIELLSWTYLVRGGIPAFARGSD